MLAHLRDESTQEGASLGCVPLVTATMRRAASAGPCPCPCSDSCSCLGEAGALEGEGGALWEVRKEMGKSSAAEM